MTGKFARVARLILCLAIAPGFSRAATVFNSFLPGDPYCSCGDWVTGSSFAPFGSPIGQQQTAGAFTPSGNYDLTQIDVAIVSYTFDYGGTSVFLLSLNNDSGGVPGTTIESWTLTANASVLTVFPVSTVPLLGGIQYWIVGSPFSSTTTDSWQLNAGDGTGPGGRLAQNSNGSGWSVANVPSDDLAFDVQGTPVPEPSGLMLIPVALMGLSLISRVRRS